MSEFTEYDVYDIPWGYWVYQYGYLIGAEDDSEGCLLTFHRGREQYNQWFSSGVILEATPAK